MSTTISLYGDDGHHQDDASFLSDSLSSESFRSSDMSTTESPCRTNFHCNYISTSSLSSAVQIRVFTVRNQSVFEPTISSTPTKLPKTSTPRHLSICSRRFIDCSCQLITTTVASSGFDSNYLIVEKSTGVISTDSKPIDKLIRSKRGRFVAKSVIKRCIQPFKKLYRRKSTHYFIN